MKVVRTKSVLTGIITTVHLGSIKGTSNTSRISYINSKTEVIYKDPRPPQCCYCAPTLPAAGPRRLQRACLDCCLKAARAAGQAQTSHSLANPVQGPLFGGLYQTDQAQRRLCLIPELGARPKANYHQLPFPDCV